MSALSGADRGTIARARELAGIKGDEAVAEHTGTGDFPYAYIALLGEAQHLLSELADLAERLGGEDGAR